MPGNLGDLVVRILGDTKSFDKALSKAEKALKVTADKMVKVGGSMTKFVTLPLLGIAAASVKAASDAEETAAKFGTAFRAVRREADKTARELAEGYGLSQTTAQRLLSTTGDLLKGFGATGQEALELSNTVQELAVDLVSYNNIQGGAARASTILTKALLGEREGLVELGAKVSEADVQTRLLEQGQEKLEGRALMLARAQATVQLVIEQNTDAMGDFARTSGSVANTTKTLGERFQDLKVEIGNQLLPAVSDLLSGALRLVEWLTKMDEGTKTFLKTVGTIAAVMGPAILIVGKLTKAIIAFRVAMKTTQGVIGLVSIGVTAVIAVIAGLVRGSKAATAQQEKLNAAQETGIEVAEDYRKTLEELKAELRDTAGLSFAEGPKELLAALKEELQAKQDLLETTEATAAATVDQTEKELELRKKIAEKTGLLARQTEAGWVRAAANTAEEIAGYVKALEPLEDVREAQDAKALQARGDYIKAIGATIKDIEQEIVATEELAAAKAKTTHVDTLRRIKAQEDILAGFQVIRQEEALAVKSGEEFNAVQERREVVLDAIQGLIEDNFTVEGAGIQKILAQYGDVFDNYDAQVQALKELEEQRKNDEKAATEAMEAERLRSESILTYGAMEIELARNVAAEQWRLAWELYDKKKRLRDKEKEERQQLERHLGNLAIDAAQNLVLGISQIWDNLHREQQQRKEAEREKAIQVDLQKVQSAAATAREIAGLQNTAQLVALAKYETLTVAEQEYQDFLVQKERARVELLDDAGKTENALKVKAHEAEKKRLGERSEEEKRIAKATAATLAAIDKKRAEDTIAMQKAVEVDKQRIARNEADMRKAAEREKRRLARTEAERNRNLAIFQTIVNTAGAIVKALFDPGGWAGLGMSVAAGVTGATQLAAIATAPLPQLKHGGKIRPTVGGIARVAEAGIAEFQVPDSTDAFDELAAKIAHQMDRVHIDGSVNMPAQMMHVTVNLGDKTLYDDIARATADGRLLIDARAVV